MKSESMKAFGVFMKQRLERFVIRGEHFKELRLVVSPNADFSVQAETLLGLIIFGTLFLLWCWVKIPFLPQPQALWPAFVRLWDVNALAMATIESLMLYSKAVVISLVIAGILVYSTILPLMRPVVNFLALLRYLSMAGMNLFFIIFFGTSEESKLLIMVFYVTIALIKSFLDVKKAIEPRFYDHARTVYRSEWRVAWAVITRRNLGEFLVAIRQNQPTGWTMVFIVEGFILNGTGVGGIITRMLHNPKIDEVGVVLVLGVIVGLLIDLFWTIMIITSCPEMVHKLNRRSK